MAKYFFCNKFVNEMFLGCNIKNLFGSRESRAFDNWQKRPWNRSLSFEDFCEYLLPYRIWDAPFILVR